MIAAPIVVIGLLADTPGETGVPTESPPPSPALGDDNTDPVFFDQMTCWPREHLMDRPFRRRVDLSEEERLMFDELVSGLESVREPRTSSGHLGLATRVQVMFWRHRVIATLLVPVGLLVMMMAVASWWPLGAVGVALLGVGVLATNDLVGEWLKGVWRSSRTPRKRPRPDDTGPGALGSSTW